jgi:hypothetical protein
MVPAGVQHSTGRVAVNVAQLNRHVNDGQELTCSIGPFDNDYGVGFQYVVPTNVLEISQAGEAKQIDMIYRRFGRIVYVNDGERWARHLFWNAIALAYRPCQRRLPSPEIAGKRYHKRRINLASEAPPPVTQFAPRYREFAFSRQGREEVRVTHFATFKSNS